MAEEFGRQRGTDSAAKERGFSALRSRPFALWVIVGALVYTGVAVLFALAIPFALAFGLLAFGGILILIFLFVAWFLLAAVFVFRGKRWAYVFTVVVSIVFILINITEIASSASNPADSYFWLSISFVPALVLAVVFSILSFRHAKTGLLQKRYLATPHSTGGLLTFAVIGFVIGGLVVGAIGAGVIRGLISAVNPDIKIVPGAMTAAVPYDPQVSHVAVGGTLTWQNTDSTTHTVTSNDTGLFDSGPLSTGATWSHIFTQAGTYYYHCKPHPQMWGVIIVEG